jgi:hypothetical protein
MILESKLCVLPRRVQRNNQGIPGGYVEASGATYGQPQNWVTPRTYLISGRLSF